MQDLKSTLSTIAEMAPTLARARICRVTVGEVSFEISPEAPAPVESAPIQAAPPVDPLNDPKTYGWENGVPGFTDPRKAKQ